MSDDKLEEEDSSKNGLLEKIGNFFQGEPKNQDDLLEIIDDAKKVTEEDIEKYIKKTLQMNRLKFFGITNIKYKGRKITIKKRGRYSNMLPVIFKHDNIDLPILLK